MRKPLKLLLTTVTLFMAVFLFSEMCSAQEEGSVDLFDRRHAVFSYASDGGIHNIAVNATLPIKQIHGGVTAGLVRTISDGESISDEADARAEAGFENNLLQAKAFVGLERSLQKGSDLTKEVGVYFGTPELSYSIITAEFALGTLFESTEYQAVLNLESENAGRLLGLAKVSVGRLGVYFETTPRVNFDDFELSLKPHYLFKFADNFSFRIDTEFDYTSAPVLGSDKWTSRWSVGGDLEF